ncbi:MAG: LacI family DNA-binding transcriptional regulator [Geminicoccaceae bacterium]|nr:LacI family DNA-binding transcriptional regulator [Geminicoccaceae bacterium]MCB9944039.1 LacI family DNA-binding transcriptional regulator [Geminicoccaceae bacterium]
MARARGTGPSQADLAAELNLSVSTVSRALSNAPGISDDVRYRVSQAALRLGYRTRDAALRSAFGRIVVMATLYDVNSTLSWVYQEMLEGITLGARQGGIAVECHMTTEIERLPSDLDPATGLVFLGIVPDEATIDWLVQRDIASIIVNGVDPTLRVDSVSPANYFGGRLVAEYLTRLGHRKAAFVGGTSRWTLVRRFHGFRDALGDFRGDDDGVVDVLHLHSDITQRHIDRLREWLPTVLDEATALFCYNDSIAISAIEALTSLGRSVPDDVSVVGFDDMPMATMTTPKLTTFRIDWRGIGSDAVHHLRQRRARPEGAARELQIGGQLVERQSTAFRN